MSYCKRNFILIQILVKIMCYLYWLQINWFTIFCVLAIKLDLVVTELIYLIDDVWLKNNSFPVNRSNYPIPVNFPITCCLRNYMLCSVFWVKEQRAWCYSLVSAQCKSRVYCFILSLLIQINASLMQISAKNH